MSRRSRIGLVAPIALAALAFAPAAFPQQKGDQWEITVKMQMEGMPSGMPAHTVRMCLDKRARDEAYVPRSRGDCKMLDSSKAGNTLRYRMECGGGGDPMVADGEITWTSDRYDGKMHMKGKSGGDGFDMSQTFTGRKIGECSDPVH